MEQKRFTLQREKLSNGFYQFRVLTANGEILATRKSSHRYVAATLWDYPSDERPLAEVNFHRSTRIADKVRRQPKMFRLLRGTALLEGGEL